MSTTATMTAAATKMSTPTTSWADGPYPLIPSPLPNGQGSYKAEHASLHFADVMAHNMSHLHNMLLRYLNAMWQQAPHIKTERDVVEFREFCAFWPWLMHNHHDSEETVFFPAIDQLAGQPGYMDGNVEQHRAFEGGVKRLDEYCKQITPANYDGLALRGVIDSFAGILAEHLADEIKSLQSLRNLDSTKLKKIWDDTGAYARSHGRNNVVFPFIVGTYDMDFEGGAQSEFTLPIFAYWLNDLYFSWKYSNSWRFLPCDSRGHRRDFAIMSQQSK